MSLSLSAWQQQSVAALQKKNMPAASVRDVTLLAYFFWDDDRINTQFFTIECAFLCAHYFLGELPSVLVVNRLTPRIKAFCDQHHIDIQVDATLTGGVPRMNIDCITTLHKRFSTPYVLIIQSDGFPLQSGIEPFVGKYDYVGAPWIRHLSWYDWFPYPRYCVGNGGFALRSKKICEQASRAYSRWCSRLPYTWLVGDDVFYCKTMPFLSREWRASIVYAPPEVAGRFSVEHNDEFFPKDRQPFGFHARYGFERIANRFGLPTFEL